MSIRYISAIALATLFTFPAAAKNKTETVSLTSTPLGASVKIYSTFPKAKTYGVCDTPCEIKVKSPVDSPYGYFVLFTKNDLMPQSFTTDQGQEIKGIRRFHATLLTEAQSLIEENEKKRAEALEFLEACERDDLGQPQDRSLPKLCKRYPPQYPIRMDGDGSCDMTFDISREGFTKNVTIISCTDARLERESVKSVSRWLYLPAKFNGVPVETKDQTLKISYRQSGGNAP